MAAEEVRHKEKKNHTKIIVRNAKVNTDEIWNRRLTELQENKKMF